MIEGEKGGETWRNRKNTDRETERERGGGVERPREIDYNHYKTMQRLYSASFGPKKALLR